jgi:hypothetical protein
MQIANILKPKKFIQFIFESAKKITRFCKILCVSTVLIFSQGL